MTDYSGMFSGLNQAISQNPAGLQFNAGVPGIPASPMDTVNPLLQGAVSGVADAFGVKGDFTTGQQKYAQLYQAEQAKAAQLAQDQSDYRIKLVKEAEAMGLPDLANRAKHQVGELGDLAKELAKAKEKELTLKYGKPIKVARALRAGYSKTQAEEMSNLPAKEFEESINDAKAETKNYMLPDGTNRPFKVDTFGNVQIGGKWVDPLDVGLRAAQNQQSVTHYNVNSYVGESLDKMAVENLEVMRTAATEAQGKAADIAQRMTLVDKMPTGIFANVDQNFRELGAGLGLDWKDPSAAQGYLMSSAKDVLLVLKDMGGSDSDNDREWAKQVVAGDIKLSKAAIKRLLTIEHKIAQTKVTSFQTAFDKARKDPANISSTLEVPSVPNLPSSSSRESGGPKSFVWTVGPDGKPVKEEAK